MDAPLQTIADVLKQCVPPPLPMDPDFLEMEAAASEATVQLRVDCTLARWTSFDEDLEPQKRLLRDQAATTKLKSPVARQAATSSVITKGDVLAAFTDHVESRVTAILQALGKPAYEFLSPMDCQPAMVGCPERVLAKQGSPLCPLELETPWSMNVSASKDGPTLDLVEQWNREAKTNRERSRFCLSMVRISEYMAVNQMKYAILTLYDYTYFFRRRQAGSFLQVSRAVPTAEVLSRLVEFFLWMDEGGGAPHNTPSPQKAAPTGSWPLAREAERHQLVTLQPEQFLFTETITATLFGTVVRGFLAGKREAVIFKVRDVSKRHSVDKDLQREAQVYHELRALQGKEIPYCYGYVDFNGMLRGLVLDPCGSAIAPEKLQQHAKELDRMVRTLHQHGYVHGDLDRCNILEDPLNGKLWLTDLRRAEKADQEKIDEEMERLQTVIYAHSPVPSRATRSPTGYHG